MPWETIRKPDRGWSVPPNLADYEQTRARFSWQEARSCLDGLPDGGGLNIGHEAVDRHAEGPTGQRVALRWMDREGRAQDYTYRRLRDLSNRFANVLRGLGVGKGDTVAVLATRVPELYIAALGTFKNGGVFCPLFSAFGPEPIRTRLAMGRAKVLVTTATLYRRKVREIRDALPQLEQVLIVGGEGDPDGLEGTRDLNRLLDAADGDFSIPPTGADDRAILHFTSGTTGTPKGVVHVHGAVLMHNLSARLALDLRPGDIFWCTADPGWVTGTSYGIIAPLTLGATLLVDSEEFDAERWYRLLQEQQVNVWYTAPTAIRMLMRTGSELARRFDTRHLRFMASVGEPLNPEAVCWGEEAFGQPFHDNWWQTETGGIMIANYRAMDIKPGSMGRPLPGIDAEIVARDEAGQLTVITDPDVAGELAIRTGWPSMFTTYLDQDSRYAACFCQGWYLTGDLAKRDSDGYFWFVGRADDVIKSAGHLIGPFEVESALMEHPAVAEVGVIGKPDPVVMEIVKAFVTLRPGVEANDALRRELLGHARRRLGAAVAPREIDFCDDLPKNRSGKIVRRLLKARELGLPEGDLSTLQDRQ